MNLFTLYIKRLYQHNINFLFNKDLFYDRIIIMKQKISFLIAIISAIGTHGAFSSECIGSDCEIIPMTEETIIISKPVSEYEQTFCTYDYNCPFDNAADCEIWYKKPTYKQNVYPRAEHLSFAKAESVLYGINSSNDFSANDESAKPLLERYLMLQRASESCCEAGIIYKLRQKGASEEEIYNFLKDDANYYAIKTRCLMTDNEGIETTYSNGVDGKMVFDVRNACLCKNKAWFKALLAPYKDIYKRAPQFINMDFNYTYTDGMNREVCISVNKDVQTTMNLLESCPK